MNAVEVVGLTVDYGTHRVLADLTLEVPEGLFVGLVGPSGCGKSTLLRCIAGLLQPTRGTVRILGQPLNGPSPAVGILFQEDALLPWRTAQENVALGLRFRGTPRATAQEEALRWLDRVGLRAFARHYPAELSGGMKKRVALAQVLACRPRVLLMDEPFANLDAIVRHLVERDFLVLAEHERLTVLLVTHDLEEALLLSDRVAVMSAGPCRPRGEHLRGAVPPAPGPHAASGRSALRRAPRPDLGGPAPGGGPDGVGGCGMRRAGVLLASLVAWELLARLRWLDPLLFPPPTEVAGVLYGLCTSSGFWGHVRTTLLEALGGLGLGVSVGGLLGLAAATFAPAAEVLEPVMALLNAIPRVILAPLFVIWLGIGMASKVALSFVLVCVVVFFSVYTGIREVDPRLVDRVRTLGGSPLDVVREVYLPSLAAWLVSGLKVAVGFAFTGAVVGEFVAASRGLGYLLSFAQSTYNARLTLALVLLVVGVILALFGLFGGLERYWLRWKPEHRRTALRFEPRAAPPPSPSSQVDSGEGVTARP